jgi:deoxyribonuclease-1-like protein
LPAYFLNLKLPLIVLFLFILSCPVLGQTRLSVCSWNLKDLGNAKSDDEIEIIANTIKQFDVIAIQEVVAGYGGPQAVGRLHNALNRKGTKWDYVLSEPTSSSAYKTERYAFLWKTSRLKKVGDAWLEKKYHFEIDREPFYITFDSNGKQFTLVSFHAITKSMQPEREIKYFKFLPAMYSNLNLIFAGDFNVPQSHTVFIPLRKLGYVSALTNQKTSLKQTCVNNDCLFSEFDNFYFRKSRIKSHSSGIIPFYEKIPDHRQARLISDHVPIFFQFSLN